MVVIEFEARSSQGISLAYQDLAALLCRPKKRECVLLHAGTEDAEMHYALRDVLHTVARVVGEPLELRVALLGRSRALAAVCRGMQPALAALGCELRLFHGERQAVTWLLSSPSLSARAPAAAAVAIPT